MYLPLAVVALMGRKKKTQLEVTKHIKGIVNRAKGDLIDYYPWDFKWQGMTEPERVEKGIYVICYGHGEFEVLKEGIDVKCK